MNRKKYHVMPHGDGWQISFENSERASILANTKEEAVQEAMDLAKNQEPSQLFIHGTDGKIMEERTYPRSSDPVETPG